VIEINGRDETSLVAILDGLDTLEHKHTDDGSVQEVIRVMQPRHGFCPRTRSRWWTAAKTAGEAGRIDVA
jgi:hypothetical protein